MGDVSAEPSMEDILSSIKRIIAEEGETAAASRARRATKPVPQSVAIPEPMSSSEGVLELSEEIAAEPASLEPTPTQRQQRTPSEPLEPPSPAGFAAATADPILSPKTAEASRGALDSLSRLIVRSDEQPGDNTLEALVRELLRPMLREWLDAKLPGIVESMVAREIARITSQH
ncbi:MAG: DUF2497 domain-containing protein [Sphingomonas sp.]|jgi:hypothetical protein